MELVFLVFITYTLEKRFHRSRYHIDAHKRIHQPEQKILPEVIGL